MTPETVNLPTPTEKPSPPARRKRLTRQGLRREAERQMVKAAPDVLKKYWAAVEKGLEKGEKWAADAVGQAFGYTRAAGGATIIQAIQNNTINRDPDGGGVRSFESIIRKLEMEAEVSGPLAQPDEDEDDEDDDSDDDAGDRVIDVEAIPAE